MYTSIKFWITRSWKHRSRDLNLCMSSQFSHSLHCSLLIFGPHKPLSLHLCIQISCIAQTQFHYTLVNMTYILVNMTYILHLNDCLSLCVQFWISKIPCGILILCMFESGCQSATKVLGIRLTVKDDCSGEMLSIYHKGF
jgi:hypothetical protein